MMLLPAQQAGRTCPTGYRYAPHVFQRAPDLIAETLYVVGGLYGNRAALDAVELLARRDTARIIFNGDFHWFDLGNDLFDEIHRRVLAHTALRGNVETELAGDGGVAGCGCAYPAYVGDDEVERSNRIIERLHVTAEQVLGPARNAMANLPMHLVAQVGALRIGVVHGDAHSLAGWDFSSERLDDPTQHGYYKAIFRQSGVDLFASSHTCLPALRRFTVDGRDCAVINNGAAGMPNFSATHFGVISRISTTPAADFLHKLTEQVVEIAGQKAYVSAIALDYDHAAWRQQFCADWPHGSPASLSYLQRIESGPPYSIDQAYPTLRN